MAGRIPIPEENVRFIVEDLTPERILRYIDIEDRLRGVDLKDIIRHLSDEDLRELRRLLNEKSNGRKSRQ